MIEAELRSASDAEGSMRSRYIEDVTLRSRMELMMRDLDRLHAIVDLLSLPAPISDAEFAHRLSNAPEEEVDEETSARILASEAERGESISPIELKRRLGL